MTRQHEIEKTNEDKEYSKVGYVGNVDTVTRGDMHYLRENLYIWARGALGVVDIRFGSFQFLFFASVPQL